MIELPIVDNHASRDRIDPPSLTRAADDSDRDSFAHVLGASSRSAPKRPSQSTSSPPEERVQESDKQPPVSSTARRTTEQGGKSDAEANDANAADRPARSEDDRSEREKEQAADQPEPAAPAADSESEQPPTTPERLPKDKDAEATAQLRAGPTGGPKPSPEQSTDGTSPTGSASQHATTSENATESAGADTPATNTAGANAAKGAAASAAVPASRPSRGTDKFRTEAAGNQKVSPGTAAPEEITQQTPHVEAAGQRAVTTDNTPSRGDGPTTTQLAEDGSTARRQLPAKRKIWSSKGERAGKAGQAAGTGESFAADQPPHAAAAVSELPHNAIGKGTASELSTEAKASEEGQAAASQESLSGESAVAAGNPASFQSPGAVVASNGDRSQWQLNRAAHRGWERAGSRESILSAMQFSHDSSETVSKALSDDRGASKVESASQEKAGEQFVRSLQTDADPRSAQSAEMRAEMAARRSAGRADNGPPLTQTDQTRLIQRVTRAIEAAPDRGGTLRLRLRPPELGSLELEVSIKKGGLTARLEAETQSARNVLLDNLPQLRERLTEQGVRVEQFDVQVSQRDGGEAQQHGPRQQGNSRQGKGSGGLFSEGADNDEAAASPELVPLVGRRNLNVLI